MILSRELDYKYRPDGIYLVRSKCSHCGEMFEMLAIAQFTELCDACRQVEKWEQGS